MSSHTLRAMVIGAGWAGEGHTKALQHQGVDVVAICARNKDVVHHVAAHLGVPHASTAWRHSLVQLKPDLVALATPAAVRTEVVERAAQSGCHILCEKPLATTAEEAHDLYTIVKQAGVKHAYASTHKYDPSVLWAADLISNQTIGTLQGIDVTLSLPYFKETTPWGWWDTLSQGGGGLNGGLTHLLGMLETITKRTLIAAVGEARVRRTTAPVVPDLHDFRQITAREMTMDDAAKLEWRMCDADTAFSAILQFASSSGSEETIPVIVRANLCAPLPGPTNGWYFYGEKGTLVGQGSFSMALFHHRVLGVEPLPIPPHLADTLPHIGNDVQNKWGALVRDFIADIRHEAHDDYLTFKAGWRYQAAIDAIRQRKGWFPIEEDDA